MTDKIYGQSYRRARREAFRRSFGVCQFCGHRQALEAHHWGGTPLAGRYPRDEEVGEGDLTGLCVECHELATMLRILLRHKNADDVGLIVRGFVAQMAVEATKLPKLNRQEIETVMGALP